MYQAKFSWEQNTKFPIWKSVIEPYIKTIGGDSAPAGNSTKELEDVVVYLTIPEDFSYEIKSNFQGYAEAIGSVSSMAGSILEFFNKLNTLSGIGGKSSNSSEYMKMQVWKETEPFRMSFKFLLETKSDPFIDVYAPAMALCSMAILSPVLDGNDTVFYTPGVNSGGMKALNRGTGSDQSKPSGKSSGKQSTGDSTNSAKDDGPSDDQRKSWSKNSKLLSNFSIIAAEVDGGTNVLNKPSPKVGSQWDSTTEIPFLIINDAFIETAKPTWSKERTTSGIPLRCELEVTVQSLFSAHDSMFGYLQKNPRGLLTAAADTAKAVATNIFR